MAHYQDDLFGGRMALGSATDRVYWLMIEDEGCRNYLMELLWAAWAEEGLLDFIYPEKHDEATSWFVSKATNAKSLINRWQEYRRKCAHLAPSADVAEKKGL